MKPILHLKIYLDPKGGYMVPPETAIQLAQKVKEEVGNDYYVIVTPFEPSIVEKE